MYSVHFFHFGQFDRKLLRFIYFGLYFFIISKEHFFIYSWEILLQFIYLCTLHMFLSRWPPISFISKGFKDYIKHIDPLYSISVVDFFPIQVASTSLTRWRILIFNYLNFMLQGVMLLLFLCMFWVFKLVVFSLMGSAFWIRIKNHFLQGCGSIHLYFLLVIIWF